MCWYMQYRMEMERIKKGSGLDGKRGECFRVAPTFRNKLIRVLRKVERQRI